MRVKLKEVSISNLLDYNGPAGEIVITEGSKDFNVMNGVSPGGINITGAISEYTVSTPGIISPIAGDTVPLSNVVFSSTPYSGDGGHLSTTWEIATDLFFNNIVHTTQTGTGLIEIYLSKSVASLTPNTGYYIRTRHTSTIAGNSAWSQPVQFISGNLEASTLIQTINAPGSGLSDGFGVSCAISTDGNTIAIGSYSANTYNGLLSGEVTVYQRMESVWVKAASIIGSTVKSGDRFGVSVAISADGSSIAIGSYLSGVGGQVFIFKLTNGSWVETAIVEAISPTQGAYFGNSVSLNSTGNVLVVGSINENKDPSYTGGVYIFNSDINGNWIVQQRIPAIAQRYGSGVAISGDGTIGAIAAYEAAVGGFINVGVVYIYGISNGIWTEIQQILPGTPLDNLLFGRLISLDSTGTYLTVGSRFDTQVAFDSGALHIYRINPIAGAFALSKTLSSPYPVYGGNYGFGNSVASNGSLIISGEFLNGGGKVHIYA